MITAGRLPQWSLLRIGTPPLSHFVGKYRNTKEQQRILKQKTAPQNRQTAAVTLQGELQKENSRKTQKHRKAHHCFMHLLCWKLLETANLVKI